MSNYPKFPIYIPSKGRSEYMMTSRALTKMGVHHNVVVEPSEVDAYRVAARGLNATIIELDMEYKKKYELCDDLGQTKSTGPGPARNFIWDHSIKSGHEWHWVMDDNIQKFYRMKSNLRIRCHSPAFWAAMEDFVLRYKNVGMAGPNYAMFAFSASKLPPFIINTRIYSCNLIRNDIPYRWRGRYNEDTILSIDMLKDGWCTIQFNAFLQAKIRTQTIGGGNTAEFYEKEGTKAKSKMLFDVHPDCSRVVFKFGRVHHYVNYKMFKHHPILKEGIGIKNGTDEYGMRLKKSG